MNQQPDCAMCKLLARELDVSMVHEDELCSAFMDIQPVNEGHILVVPNRHVVEVPDLTEEEGARIFVIAERINRAIRKSDIKSEGINFFVADGEAAGQEVFHVHLHVFPRFKGDGFRLVLPPNYGERPPRTTLNELAAKIKAHLD